MTQLLICTSSTLNPDQLPNKFYLPTKPINLPFLNLYAQRHALTNLQTKFICTCMSKPNQFLNFFASSENIHTIPILKH